MIDLESKMSTAVLHFEKELSTLRTSRANPDQEIAQTQASTQTKTKVKPNHKNNAESTLNDRLQKTMFNLYNVFLLPLRQHRPWRSVQNALTPIAKKTMQTLHACTRIPKRNALKKLLKGNIVYNKRVRCMIKHCGGI